MESASEYINLIANRENLYRMLARFYRIEVDEPFLHQLTETTFPTECDDPDLAEGYALLSAWLFDPGDDPINDLAVDYARVFLGAGVFDEPVAFPYESVYTSKERLIMQQARDEVVEIYRAHGLDRIATFEVPEDHISIELEFMSYLCGKSREALAAGNIEQALTLFQEQKDFLDKHPSRWFPSFCADIESFATTDFYLAVGKMTLGFLNMERAIIDEFIRELGAQRHAIN